VSKNLLGFTAILKWKPKRHEGGGGGLGIRVWAKNGEKSFSGFLHSVSIKLFLNFPQNLDKFSNFIKI